MHPISRRHTLIHLTALLATVPGLNVANAQQPQLDLAKILVGLPPGGGVDTVARRVAEGLRGTYARTVLVENKPGSSARLVVEDIVRGPVDGSLLLVQPSPVMTQQPHVDPKNTRYRFDDLTPIASLVVIHHALAVGPAVPSSVRTMQGFLEWAKANPAQANYGTPGLNSPQDFLMKVATKGHGIELTHVPYKGAAPGMHDLLAGHVAAMFSPVGDSLAHLGSGKVRIIGTTGPKRSSFVPTVPTFREQGFAGMELFEPFGLWAKAGVDDATLERLHDAVQKVLVKPELIDSFGKAGMEVSPMSRQAFISISRESYAAWGERVRITGFKPE